VRSKANIENEGGREKIVITEIPYLVNKSELIQKVADLVNEKKIEGISNANDESDRTGMRIVFDIKKDAIANIVLNKLFKYTQLQSAFSINNIALVKGRPQLLNIKELIETFIEHRHEVVFRRTQFELEQAEKKAHILEGLIIAVNNLDEVIALIRASSTPEEARNGLMEKFELSEIQARAILDMRLQKLTGLEIEKLRQEYDEIMKLIEELKAILADKQLRMKIIKDELIEIKGKYGDDRLTQIEYSSEEFNPEDFYADEDVAITISNLGYIKRTALTEYKTQNRGGTGAKGGSTRDEDHLEHMYIASMHNTMLFFTEKGKCFWLKVYEIPEGSRLSKGRAIQNLLNLESDDKVKAFVNVDNLIDEEYIKTHNIILCTKNGVVKKTPLSDFSRPRQNGIIAITIREGDSLLQARLTNGNDEVIIAARSGKALRFNETTVRPMGRTASGVRGISISKGDEVIGMVVLQEKDETILVVSENGYGKRSLLEDYRITNRGGKGVKTLNITKKTGNLIAIKNVKDDNDIMIINRSGLTIRIAVANIRVSGRATQGVRLINLKGKDLIASVAKVEISGVEESNLDIMPENIELNGNGEQ
jgi:DNA gyrase subunit A